VSAAHQRQATVGTAETIQVRPSSTTIEIIHYEINDAPTEQKATQHTIAVRQEKPG
jgi:hypothetical protein